jgi:hypothetical protein
MVLFEYMSFVLNFKASPLSGQLNFAMLLPALFDLFMFPEELRERLSGASP